MLKLRVSPGLGRGVCGESLEFRKVYGLGLELELRVSPRFRPWGSMLEFRV